MNSIVRTCVAILITSTLSACAAGTSAPAPYPAPSAAALDCVQKVAAQKGYSEVSKMEGSTVLARRRHVFIGREVLSRVLSFGFVSADQGREDRLMVTRAYNQLRVDVVGVLGSGSDVAPTATGKRDAAEVLNACATFAQR